MRFSPILNTSALRLLDMSPCLAMSFLKKKKEKKENMSIPHIPHIFPSLLSSVPVRCLYEKKNYKSILSSAPARLRLMEMSSEKENI